LENKRCGSSVSVFSRKYTSDLLQFAQIFDKIFAWLLGKNTTYYGEIKEITHVFFQGLIFSISSVTRQQGDPGLFYKAKTAHIFCGFLKPCNAY
jgi:hypothetical protein